MKVGIIVESGPQGADLQVLCYLVEQLVPGATVSPATFHNKKELVDKCGVAASRLLVERCDKVLIVWDLYPAWREKNMRPDCQEDCRSIRQSLRSSGITGKNPRVVLVCIREELEAWLISDGRALSQVLSRRTYQVRIGDTKYPDRYRNPKSKLRKLFQQHAHTDYSDRTHAIAIVKAMPDHNRIGRSQSFRRFRDKMQRGEGTR